MADYGHDLAFGTFITPQNRRPRDVVALAQLTERSGLDLATFQDHPYQSAFLDTWTLLSWIAAQTETVRVAPNVLNLPLRQPAVVARAAASLDLLSGGRVELGLGAGAFWDAMDAMGAPRRTPAEAVDALEEAIETSARSGIPASAVVCTSTASTTASGAPSAAPGPTTTSRSGWAPSSHACLTHRAQGRRLAPEPLLPGGRRPGPRQPGHRRGGGRRRARSTRVRRLLNVHGTFSAVNRGFLQGPPDQWAEELLPLVLEHGVSTFILAGDDPGAIERYGAEVTPAVREAAARERQASRR
jgi:Luciferase-like monooxygenase